MLTEPREQPDVSACRRNGMRLKFKGQNVNNVPHGFFFSWMYFWHFLRRRVPPRHRGSLRAGTRSRQDCPRTLSRLHWRWRCWDRTRRRWRGAGQSAGSEGAAARRATRGISFCKLTGKLRILKESTGLDKSG